MADELGFKPSKVWKLLMTANVRFDKAIYCNDISNEFMRLYKEGKTASGIMEYTGLKRSAVFSYLPYSKTVYKATELSNDSERIQLLRLRQKRCRNI